MNKINQMLLLQQQLNDATSGEGWENGVTNKGKNIDWKRCIFLEAAELIESYPWKHWKNINASPDYANIKIEIVDIWHFIMSEALRIYKLEKRGGINDLTQAIIKLDSYDFFANNNKQNKLDIYQQMAIVENMLTQLFINSDIHQLIDAFLEMSAKLNLKLTELYQLYIGKNILNQFRQDHGYKEGKYFKEWNGVEDNVVMQEILKKNPEISVKELYQKLEKNYPDK